MADALKIHIQHEEALEKSQTKLEMTNRQLVAEKELNQKLVKDKIKQSSRHKKQIKDLQVYMREKRRTYVNFWCFFV